MLLYQVGCMQYCLSAILLMCVFVTVFDNMWVYKNFETVALYLF